ncbi:hypothetical protein [Sphingomonas sp.]|uniref:hypothetical protein n=1 Tax=Sphingomonas sp. TaxID=28214 RepID=UPI002ED84091
MNRAQFPAGLRNGWRPLAGYAVTVALAIAVYELLRFLGPAMPAWVTSVIALGMIAYGLFLTVQRIRRPLFDHEGDAGWTGPPTFITFGALILILKFASE